ncbi:MAG: 1,4-alpha-glucan branching protein GlgB [Clostridia bacterium]|nr:1,4-alpha-glucan branching protein GlgB [Clostridia bacterium]
MSKNSYDYPIYLFNEGTNYESYTFFCPCYTQKNGKKYWRFRVWAPNAKEISVVGDFNNWDRNANPMERIGQSGIWECFISGVKRYDIYKFSILDNYGTVRLKSDPFATHTETMPANGSKIYDILGYEWHDEEFLKERATKNTYKGPMNIYEVHLGSWKRHEDGNPYSYLDLARELVPYVKSMGYTHIELLPITEYPYEGSWGYQTTGLYAPTSRYGTPNDFMAFIDACHAEGISVIMDFVLSHFPKDAFGLYEFDGTYQYEYGDIYKQEHKTWGTRVYDFGKPQVRSFLISAIDFWISKYHIDGMRLDAVASMLYLNYDRRDGEWMPNEYGGEYNLEAIYFLQCMNKAILSRHPDVIMIAEESTAFPMVTMPPSMGGLGFNYKWNMGWMNDTLDYIKIDPYFRKGAHNKLTFSITYAFSENYILPFSHDEVVHGKCSLMGKIPTEYENKFKGDKTLLSYQMAHPGKKLNFMGYEFAQFIEWDYKKELDWLLLQYDKHRLFNEYIKDLNNLYKSKKPLYELDCSYDGFKWTVVDDNTQNIVVFNRYASNGDSIIFVGNFSTVQRDDYVIGVDKKGKYKVILNSEWKKYGGDFEVEKLLETTDTPSHGKEQSLSIKIPACGSLFIELVEEFVEDEKVIKDDSEYDEKEIDKFKAIKRKLDKKSKK